MKRLHSNSGYAICPPFCPRRRIRPRRGVRAAGPRAWTVGGRQNLLQRFEKAQFGLGYDRAVPFLPAPAGASGLKEGSDRHALRARTVGGQELPTRSTYGQRARPSPDQVRGMRGGAPRSGSAIAAARKISCNASKRLEFGLRDRIEPSATSSAPADSGLGEGPERRDPRAWTGVPAGKICRNALKKARFGLGIGSARLLRRSGCALRRVEARVLPSGGATATMVALTRAAAGFSIGRTPGPSPHDRRRPCRLVRSRAAGRGPLRRPFAAQRLDAGVWRPGAGPGARRR